MFQNAPLARHDYKCSHSNLNHVSNPLLCLSSSRFFFHLIIFFPAKSLRLNFFLQLPGKNQLKFRTVDKWYRAGLKQSWSCHRSSRWTVSSKKKKLIKKFMRKSTRNDCFQRRLISNHMIDLRYCPVVVRFDKNSCNYGGMLTWFGIDVTQFTSCTMACYIRLNN